MTWIDWLIKIEVCDQENVITSVTSATPDEPPWRMTALELQ